MRHTVAAAVFASVPQRSCLRSSGPQTVSSGGTAPGQEPRKCIVAQQRSSAFLLAFLGPVDGLAAACRPAIRGGRAPPLGWVALLVQACGDQTGPKLPTRTQLKAPPATTHRCYHSTTSTEPQPLLPHLSPSSRANAPHQRTRHQPLTRTRSLPLAVGLVSVGGRVVVGRFGRALGACRGTVPRRRWASAVLLAASAQIPLAVDSLDAVAVVRGMRAWPTGSGSGWSVGVRSSAFLSVRV